MRQRETLGSVLTIAGGIVIAFLIIRFLVRWEQAGELQREAEAIQRHQAVQQGLRFEGVREHQGSALQDQARLDEFFADAPPEVGARPAMTQRADEREFFAQLHAGDWGAKQTRASVEPRPPHKNPPWARPPNRSVDESERLRLLAIRLRGEDPALYAEAAQRVPTPPFIEPDDRGVVIAIDEAGKAHAVTLADLARMGPGFRRTRHLKLLADIAAEAEMICKERGLPRP